MNLNKHFLCAMKLYNLLILSSLHIILISEYYIHVYMRSDGLCGCVTCDAEYPARAAFSVLTKTLEDFDAQNPSWKQGELLRVVQIRVELS